MRASLLAALLLATQTLNAGSHPRDPTTGPGRPVGAHGGRLPDRLHDRRRPSGTPDPHLRRQGAFTSTNPGRAPPAFTSRWFMADGLYRMYYRGHSLTTSSVRLLKPGETMVPQHPEVTCYAESKDGRTWTKPALGLVEFEGSKQNNIIWDGFGNHNFMVFLDTNLQTPPEERYKALASGQPNRPLKRMVGMVSPTESTGSRSAKRPSSRSLRRTGEGTGSSGMGFRNEYAAYLRVWFPPRHSGSGVRRGPTIRAIARATSPDFLNWSELEDIELGTGPETTSTPTASRPITGRPIFSWAFPSASFPGGPSLPIRPRAGFQTRSS